MLLNMGGFLNLDSAIDLALQADAEVLVLTETWLTDYSAAIYLRLEGFQVVALNRPHRDTKGRVGGGIMVISLVKHIVVRNVRATPETGVLSVSLSTATSAPLLLTCCYVADKASDAAGISSTEDTLQGIADHFKLLSSKYQEHLLLGDFNTNIGTHKHRDTLCKRKVDARGRRLIELLDSLDLQALHGRTSPARTTSRPVSTSADSMPIGWGREVDFIFARRDTHVSPIDPFPPSLWPSFTSHRPLVAEIPLSPCLPREAKADKSSSSSKLVTPPFGDSTYNVMAPYIIAAVREFNSRLVVPSLSEITAAFLSTAAVNLTKRETDFCIIQRSHRDSRNRWMPRTASKNRWPLPPAISSKLIQARGLFWQSVHEEKKGRPFHHLRQAAKTLQTTARQLRMKYLHTFHAHLKLNFENQRRRDPKRAFRAHRKLAPTAGVFDSSQPPGPELSAFQKTLEEVYKPQPVPPAVADNFPNAPHAPDDLPDHQLDRTVSWQEVYNVSFPAHKEVTCDACPANVRTGCNHCQQYDKDLSQWTAKDDSPHPPPTHHPTLSASTAAGLDGLPAQVLRWTLSGNGTAHEDRVALCSLLARIFSHHLTAGEAPDAMREMRSIPILKELKPGQVRDVYDIPKSYRFLTIGNTLGKVFEMVLFARIYHWAMRASLIGPENIGGLTGMGVEHHIFTLRETIKREWRKADPEPLFIFFVDFHKAYDSVHPTLIVKLLQHMGIPDKLASLLSSIYNGTTTTLGVNGESSDTLKLHTGLGQGRVLSSLLFVLFLESYLRTIKATPGLEGISLKAQGWASHQGDPIVSSLGYIDDVGVPRRLHQLRLLLKVTLDWSKQWGIRVSVGTGKTEIVAFIPPALRTSFACPDSITVDGVTVDFSREYKYLGWVVNRELSDDKRELDIIRNATREYGMNIASVKPVKNGPPLTVLQFFKTFVMSIAANMASIFKPSNELCAQIDKLALNAARLALPGFPRSTPAPILFKMTGLVPFRYIALLHRIRLFLFLTNPANAGCLSAQVYRVLELEKQAGSWYCETRDIFKALGVDVTELGDLSRIATSSAVARFVAFQCANRYLDEQAICRRNDFMSIQTYPPFLRLPSLGEYYSGKASLPASCNDPLIPLKVRRVLALGRSGRAFFLQDYMPNSLEHSLSTTFPAPPSGEGKAPAKCSVCRLSGHNRRKCPRSGSPLDVTCSKCKHKGHALAECNNAAPIPRYSHDRDAVFGQLKNGTSPCPLSGCPTDSPLSVHHFLNCASSRVKDLRDSIYSELPSFLANLVTRLERASSWTPSRNFQQLPPRNPSSWSATALTVKSLAEDMEWTSAEGRFIFFHCILAEPWTSTRYHHAVNNSSVPQPDLSSLFNDLALLSPLDHKVFISRWRDEGGDLGTLLSALLDNTRYPPHRFRSLTSWWIRWGGTRMHRLLSLWRDAVDSEYPKGYPIPVRYFKGTSAAVSAIPAPPALPVSSNLSNSDITASSP